MVDNNIIDLQAASITQHTDGHEKTEWVIHKNITGEVLGRLPKHLTESEVFAIMDFARKYELVALNVGIQHQKSLQNEFLKAEIDNLKEVVTGLGGENERLCSILEQHIGNKE